MRRMIFNIRTNESINRIIGSKTIKNKEKQKRRSKFAFAFLYLKDEIKNSLPNNLAYNSGNYSLKRL